MQFIDLHSDFIYKSVTKNSINFQSSLQQLIDGNCLLQVFAILFTSPLATTVLDNYKKSLKFFYNFLEENKNKIKLVKDYSELERNIKQNTISAMLSLEDSELLYLYKNDIKQIYDDGIRFAILVWDHENSIGYSYKENKGLKKEGIDLIKELEHNKIILDVSHLPDKGFDDIFKYTKSPVLASHSNARTCTNHKRNLTDEQIKKIADRNGIIGINFFPRYIDLKEISDNSSCKLIDIVTHLKWLINVGGENCIALGADFDGMPDFVLDLLEYSDSSMYSRLYKDLQKFFSITTIEKLMYKNSMNFLKENLR